MSGTNARQVGAKTAFQYSDDELVDKRPHRPVRKPLKIALVHVADKGGGAERSVLNLHQSLRAQGHESRLFVGHRHLNEPGVFEIDRRRPIPGLLKITRRLEEKGIQCLYAPWFRRLPDIIGDADVVHIHSIWKNKNGFADLAGIRELAKRHPTVMTLHDGWMLTGHCACPIGCDRWKNGCGSCPDIFRQPAMERDFSAFNWKRKRNTIEMLSLRVTAVSSWLKSQVEESPIFAGKPIHVVHNGVDPSVFRPGDKKAARVALGIPNDQFVVLLAGQSIEGIRQGMGQQAVSALNQLNDCMVHPLLIGHSANDIAATLNKPSTTLPFRNHPEEMVECYQAADLTIVTSEYETFGLIAAESLFCGTPVISFATGGLKEIIGDGTCGRLVPTGDVVALTESLSDLSRNPKVLQRMRSTCVDYARELFSINKIADEYVQVYEQAISERSGQWFSRS